MLNPILAKKNTHPRDNLIKFYARGHKYEIKTDPSSKYTSVTTWNHKHFPKFDADAIIAAIFKSKSWGPEHKYWGLTADEIKASWKSNGDAVSGAGTNMHEEIEKFMNDSRIKIEYTQKELYENYISDKLSPVNNSVEWNYFIEFIKDYPDLKPYRTEWMIFHEDLKLAGSIDMVYENNDGTLSIYDWKRCKEIIKYNTWNKFSINPLIGNMPDTNFWHYSLQLNTYKAILEAKYNKKVKELFLVRLHPDAEQKTYELIEIPFLEKEIAELFAERKIEIKV